MMIVAAAGVVMNGVIAALLWGVARDVNLRSAFLHMAGDTLSTAAVIAGGAGILLTGQNWIDPVLSLLIAALILWSSIGIVRETLNILLEGTPRGISLVDIRSGMEEVEGVINVHDLHVWSLGSQSRALACHVTIADIPPSESACILVKLNHVLKDHFHISHTTIQFEHIGCEELVRCVVPPEEMTGSQRSTRHGHEHSGNILSQEVTPSWRAVILDLSAARSTLHAPICRRLLAILCAVLCCSAYASGRANPGCGHTRAHQPSLKLSPASTPTPPILIPR